MSAIDVLDRKPDSWLTSPIREYMAGMLHEMAGILRSGQYPVGITWAAPESSRPLAPIEELILADIKQTIVSFADAPKAPPSAEKKEAGGFFAADAFTNPEHVHYAVKTTGAAMFCYLLYSLLDWPGIHTSFITCYIVALPTTAETVEKLGLRILGCLIGAAFGLAAIVFLVPFLTSIGQLMAVVFLGTLAAGYVAAGSPRISYAGFQIGFAFFLCIIQGSAPAFDLTIARDRIIGILIGNLVVYLLFTQLWPSSIAKRIDPGISSLLRQLSAMMTAVDLRARRALASAAHAQLVEVETDIDLAAYEPKGTRPSTAWLAARRLMVDTIGTLESPLRLGADHDPRASAEIAERLRALANRFSQAGTGPFTADRRVARRISPLVAMIDPGLRKLEEEAV
ncbi:MAG: FUSC family protein [Bradyrhizobium sp.]|nr:FUSC family protein [Bradyrhizobium sp.]